ncbi:dephospho-CoA kinase [Candidatus Nitrospira inopinata]|jgi:dephospho-CoA kinase|uniref:Dephospho-CoA kinase n=1 Tax=Candidatus Nitrospira inopinata TaxID=1715989 RepID=A0A0S4KYP4_9BACT|nr:dephospho-CoA kinase [Candidatus Nitrospira inopinata]CUQ67686.1 Dephospho-CoA kinase [Candidatus Nitrospira inopinata]
MLTDMVLVGLTGGVATGKSTVASMFKRCGAVIIDADALARSVVEPGKPAWREIVKLFGRGVLNPDRTINRRVLGGIVFRDPEQLRRLERIVHPRVSREQRRLLRSAFARDPRAVVVYDVPLLFEAGIERTVDHIIVVSADRDAQIARLRKRDGLSRADALRRIKSQMPLAEKRRLADFVLDGTMSKRRLFHRVKMLFQRFRTAA